MLPFLSRPGKEKKYFCRFNVRSVLEAIDVVDCECDCSLNKFVFVRLCRYFVVFCLCFCFEIHVLKFHKVLKLDIKT